MAQITISTSHGLAHISKRGRYDWYYLKLSDTSLSDKDRKIRKPLKHVNKECYREYIIREVEDIYDEIINKRPQQLSNPIRFIQEIYFPYMDKMTSVGAKLPKGRWNEIKTRNDKAIIRKYLIPFIRENNLGWKDLVDEDSNELFVDYMLQSGIKETTITKYKGLFNIMFRLAKKKKLIDRLPTYPSLDDGSERHFGMKIRSTARATDEMIRTLLDTAKNELVRPYRGKGPKGDWDRIVTRHWINILIDTGVRPFPNVPFVFDAIKEDGDSIKFYRKEKNRPEYLAEGGPRAKKSISELKQMYIRKGFQPIHILSDINGNKHSTIDRKTREFIERAGWKTLKDLGGRKYDPRSIRKWHVNHARLLGEDLQSIADRCGMKLRTLIENYLDGEHKPTTRPSNFDSVLKPTKTVLYLAQ